MPQVLGENGDGTWTVQTDDGRQVRTAYLPPGLATYSPVQMAAPVGLDASQLATGGGMAPAPTPPPPAQPSTPVDFGAYLSGSAPVAPAPPTPSVYPPTADAYANQVPLPYAPTTPAAPEPVEQPRALRPRSDFPEVMPTQPTAQQTASALVTVPLSSGGSNTKDLRDAYAQQAKGVQAAADAAAQQAASEAAVYDVQAAAARQRALEDTGRRQAVTKGVDDAVQTYSSLVAELTTPSGQIDPNRWWKDRTTGQKIAAYASSFLTGFAGRPDVIQQAIDRDIAAQTDTLDRMDRAKMQRLGASQGLVGMMRDRFSDSILAQNAARVAAIDYEEKEVRAAASRAQGPQVQAAAQVKLGEIAERKAQALAAMQQRAAQLAMAQYEAQLKAQQAQTGQQAASGAVVPISALTPELLKRAVVVGPGQAILALDPDSAGKVRALQTGYKDASGLIGKMIALRKEYGGETFDRDAVRTGKGLRSSFLLTLKNLEQTGALDKGTTEIVEPMIPEDPLEWRLGTTAVMESTLETVKAKFTNSFMTFTGRTSPDQDNAQVKKDAPKK